MDFNSTVDIIIKDLNEAGAIIDDLKNYPGVPAIQIELAKAKCRNAADVITLLKTLKAEPVAKQEPVAEEKKEIIEVPSAIKPEPSWTSGEATIKKAPVKKPVQKEPEIIPVVEKSEPESLRTELTGTILADRFSNIPATLNEQIGGNREESEVTGNLKSKPVTSLSEAIGVNDKFLFIREIFNGSPESYEQTLQAIETAAGYNEAREMVLGRQGITQESEAVRQFLGLVKRKFPADE